MNAVKTSGQFAKFITALLGEALVYLQTFGWEWNIKPAATMAAVALAVLAVPNTPKPAAAVPPIPGIRPPDAPSGITLMPPAT